jgi:RNA-directed DNA polymerase
VTLPQRSEKSAEAIVVREHEGPNREESESPVRREKAKHPKTGQLELALGGWGEAPKNQRSGEAGWARQRNERLGSTRLLMEQVVARENAIAALKRVRRNKGSPGIDGMSVDELEPYLREHWSGIREQLLAGTYQPSAVKRTLIDKTGGGKRQLGIPTVVDRFIQQLFLQVLQPVFDPTFSEHSHGFRPGRRAHNAVREAQRYVQEGRRWVVDVDLEKFFDRVNHDVLMGKLENRIGDRRMLRIIRRFLEAGIMADGVVVERYEGTPQGGPLSPLLANVLLDEVDKELERRGHCFVRYADDCNIYVTSQRAGERALAVLRCMYGKLRLRINEDKSAVARVWDRKFLGYSFWVAARGVVKLRVATKALEEMKQCVRALTRRNGGRNINQVCARLGQYLRGWWQYFRLSDTPNVFRQLDKWIHHRLRAIQLKLWKRGSAALRGLRALGVPEWLARKGAGFGQRWWAASAFGALHTALPGSHFDRLGVPRLTASTSTL